MERLQKLIVELESKIPNQEIINPLVSISSVGWHIEHSLLTINLVIEALQKSDPRLYKWTFNSTRILIFAMNRIPRGRAKAPKAVQPKLDFDSKSIKSHLEVAKLKNLEIKSIPEYAYFQHPYFGHLKLKATLRFLQIHTKHHLAIINDIIKLDRL